MQQLALHSFTIRWQNNLCRHIGWSRQQQGLSFNGAALSFWNHRRPEAPVSMLCLYWHEVDGAQTAAHPPIPVANWQVSTSHPGSRGHLNILHCTSHGDKPHTSPSDSSFTPCHRSAWLVPLVDVVTSRNHPVLGTLNPHLPEVAEAQATPWPEFDAWSWQQLRSSKMTWVPKATRSLMR